jgi:hypothetical protein
MDSSNEFRSRGPAGKPLRAQWPHKNTPNNGGQRLTKKMPVSARILSSADPRRIVDFLGFAGLAVHFLSNDLFGDLGQVSQQGRIQLLKFWP